MSATRRNVLSIAAVPVVLGSAAGLRIAVAAESHPDAELLALEQQWIVAEAAHRAACDRSSEIERSVDFPKVPSALFADEDDGSLGLRRYARPYKDDRHWYVLNEVGADKPGDSIRSPRRKPGIFPPPVGHRLYGKATMMSGMVDWPEAQARADEIIAAYDKWKGDTHAVKVASGLHRVEEETVRLGRALSAIETRIAEAHATTVDGVCVKARLTRDMISSGSEPDEDLIDGLLSDLLAMGGRS